MQPPRRDGQIRDRYLGIGRAIADVFNDDEPDTREFLESVIATMTAERQAIRQAILDSRRPDGIDSPGMSTNGRQIRNG